MDKLWTDEAWADFLILQADKRLMKKLNEILKDIDRNGHSGIGKPEPLKGELEGYWSRRIDDYHRLVYRLVQSGPSQHVEIVQCGTHYHRQGPFPPA